MVDVEPLPAASQPPPRPPRPPAPPITGGPDDGGPFEPDPLPRPRHGRPTVQTFLPDVVRQTRLVAWPSAQEVRTYAAVVLFTLAVLVTYLLAVDIITANVVDQIIKR